MQIETLGIRIDLFGWPSCADVFRGDSARKAQVKVGDTISTIGGILGTVTERDGDTVTLLIDGNTGTTMRIVIYAVQSIVEQADT